MSSLSNLKDKAEGSIPVTTVEKFWEIFDAAMMMYQDNTYSLHGDYYLSKVCGVSCNNATSAIVSCDSQDSATEIVDYISKAFSNVGDMIGSTVKSNYIELYSGSLFDVSIEIHWDNVRWAKYVNPDTHILPAGICVMDVFERISKRESNIGETLDLVCECIQSGCLDTTTVKSYVNSIECAFAKSGYCDIWHTVEDYYQRVKHNNMDMTAIYVLSFLATIAFKKGVV